MSNLTELTAQIIAARAAKQEMSSDEFQREMQMVYTFLKGVEGGDASFTAQEPSIDSKPQKINLKQYFKKDEVICLLCNKGFKTLKRHLSMAHALKPGEYRKQFGIPASQSLVAKAYSEQRKKDALDRGQGDILAKAREVRAAKKAAITADNTKTATPAVKAKATDLAVKVEPAISAKNRVAKVTAKSVKAKK